MSELRPGHQDMRNHLRVVAETCRYVTVRAVQSHCSLLKQSFPDFLPILPFYHCPHINSNKILPKIPQTCPAATIVLPTATTTAMTLVILLRMALLAHLRCRAQHQGLDSLGPAPLSYVYHVHGTHIFFLAKQVRNQPAHAQECLTLSHEAMAHQPIQICHKAVPLDAVLIRMRLHNYHIDRQLHHYLTHISARTTVIVMGHLGNRMAHRKDHEAQAGTAAADLTTNHDSRRAEVAKSLNLHHRPMQEAAEAWRAVVSL